MAQKILKISAFASLSFGLMAGCSDDSNSNSAAPLPDEETTSVSICAPDQTEFINPQDGSTYCFDSNNQLQQIIDSDGTTQEIPAATQPQEPGSIESSSSHIPEISDPSIPEVSSSSVQEPAETTCIDPVDGSVEIYKVVVGADGSTYMYTSSCNKVELTKPQNPTTPVNSSSSNVANSSNSVTNSSDSAPIIQSSSSESVSNGKAPTISYSNENVTLTNDNGCVTIDGSNTIITCAGEYTITGNGNGQVQVDAGNADNVYLYLNGLTLNNSNSAPIFVKNCDKTLIVAMDGTTSTLSDGTSYLSTFTKADGSLDTIGAAIYGKDDITIKGNGTLNVNGNYNNGIQTSNDLRIRDNPTITVTAKNNGLKGKNLVDIEGGNINITATSGDGIKSDECTINGNDTTITEGKGIVDIKGGKITITKAGDDGIQAFNYVWIRDSISAPTINVTSSGKGIVSENRVNINAGSITVSSGDDGVHSNQNIYFNGGYTTITAKGNDGVHADSTLYINDGTIYVKDSYEGLEAWYIRANGGVTDVYATDDGWNAAGGNDGSGNNNQSGNSNWGRPGGNFGGGFGGMGSSSGYLIVTGGVHYVKTGSGDTDGMDSNGELTISGGVVVVECQISGGMGGSYDSDGTATLTTKTLLGFSKSKSEAGTSYNVSFNTNSYYGNANIAFKPTTSGSYIQGTSQVSTVSNISSYAKSVTLPSGSTVYYN